MRSIKNTVKSNNVNCKRKKMKKEILWLDEIIARGINMRSHKSKALKDIDF